MSAEKQAHEFADFAAPPAFLNSEALARFCQRWHIRELSLFGSVLRDDFGPDSDVDFLLSFDPGAGADLWDMVTLREELVAIVGRNVDIVVKEALRNPYRRKAILGSYRVIHAA